MKPAPARSAGAASCVPAPQSRGNTWQSDVCAFALPFLYISQADNSVRWDLIGPFPALAGFSKLFPLRPAIGRPVGHPQINHLVAGLAVRDSGRARWPGLARFFGQFRDVFVSRCASRKLEVT